MIKNTIQNTIQNTIRNTLGDEAFRMLDLFSNGKRGVWYDPSDLSTMYQESTGGTPVTADNQPVGLMLDKSQGDLLGVELVTNGTFDADTSGWQSASDGKLNATGGNLVVTGNAGDVAYASAYPMTLEIGKQYILYVDVISFTQSADIRLGKVVTATDYAHISEAEVTAGTTYTISFTVTTTSTVWITLYGFGDGGSASFDNVSVKEVLGTTATQPVSTLRPTYRSDPDRLQIDLAEDSLLFDVPTGGIDGYMTIATADGTASYGVSLPEGQYELGGDFFPSTNSMSGFLLREGDVSKSDLRNIEKYFVSKGAKESYGDVVSFAEFWQDNNITEFPLIDTSSGISFFRAWRNNKLTSFPLIDTSSASNFQDAWYGNSLTSFPLIDTSNGTSFQSAWHGNNNLSDFPEGVFDNCSCTNFTNAFLSTNLTQQSIDNILISIASNGTSNGTFTQSGGSAPSSAGEAAIDALVTRGWAVTVTGGYQGKTLPYALFENDENGFWYEMETN